MPKNRPDQAGRVGLRPKPQRTARHSSRRKADVSSDRRCGDGDARRDRIAIGRRRRRAVWAALPHTSRQTPPVPARTDGGGEEGGVASAGLADGQLFMGCQPADMRYRRGDAPRRYYNDYYRSAADIWCRDESSGARWAVAAGQLRLGRARRDAGRHWDAMQGMWYVRVLERCHMPSGAHLLNEGPSMTPI